MEKTLFRSKLGFQQKAGGFFQEKIQAIVMHPVPGAGNLHQAMIGNGRGAAVGVRIGQPAFQSPKEQDGAGDPGEYGVQVRDVVAEGREACLLYTSRCV